MTALPVIDPETLVAVEALSPIVIEVDCTVPPETLKLELLEATAPTVIAPVRLVAPPVCEKIAGAVSRPTLRPTPVSLEPSPLILIVAGTPTGLVPLNVPILILPATAFSSAPLVMLTTAEALRLLPHPIWTVLVAFTAVPAPSILSMPLLSLPTQREA